MKVILDETAQKRVALDDDGMDVPGWIELIVNGEIVAEVHIKDLYPAAIAFKERYEQS